MMKFKKLLAAAMTGAMVFGTMAGAAPAAAIYAAETTATKSAYTIEIDYETYTANISSTTASDPYVILEVLKDETGSKTSATYTYAMNGNTEITVDLSFLKATKASYLRVHGSSETVTSDVVTVNAQPEKIKLKYVSGQTDTSKAVANNIEAAFATGGTKISAKDVEDGVYEYHTLYGGASFVSLEELDQATTEIAGTTIIVRKAATDKAPAGAEVKVKISAAPKAPKVTVDYAKGSIKLPKNTEAQIVYAGEGTEAVPATMELDASKGDLYAGSTQVTNENLTTYFSVDDTGTVANLGTATIFYSAAGESSEKEVANPLDYIKGTPAIPASSGSVVTEWVACAATTAEPANIIGWFDELKGKTDELIASGFTLVVRTKANTKKAASNASIVVIEGAAEITQTEGKDEVAVGDSKLTWKATAKGIEYTGAGFEYYDSTKSKWVTIKSGSVVKNTTITTADVKVTVRKAGVKATKTADGVMPSASIEITVAKYVDTSASGTPTPTPTEEATPTVKSVTVKVGDGENSYTTVKYAQTVTCTASVEASGDAATTVEWAVSGEEGMAISSTIDKDSGVLNVKAADDGKTLIITATSTYDETKFGTATVTVGEQYQ